MSKSSLVEFKFHSNKVSTSKNLSEINFERNWKIKCKSFNLK